MNVRKTIRHAAETLLTNARWIAATATGGVDALIKVADIELTIIFVDIMMRHLDGYQIFQLSKNNSYYGANW